MGYHFVRFDPSSLFNRKTFSIARDWTKDISIEVALETMHYKGGDITPWFRLNLPSCGPRFETQANHKFLLLKLHLLLECEKDESGQDWPIFLKQQRIRMFG